MAFLWPCSELQLLVRTSVPGHKFMGMGLGSQLWCRVPRVPHGQYRLIPISPIILVLQVPIGPQARASIDGWIAAPTTKSYRTDYCVASPSASSLILSGPPCRPPLSNLPTLARLWHTRIYGSTDDRRHWLVQGSMIDGEGNRIYRKSTIQGAATKLILVQRDASTRQKLASRDA